MLLEDARALAEIGEGGFPVAALADGELQGVLRSRVRHSERRPAATISERSKLLFRFTCHLPRLFLALDYRGMSHREQASAGT